MENKKAQLVVITHDVDPIEVRVAAAPVSLLGLDGWVRVCPRKSAKLDAGSDRPWWNGRDVSFSHKEVLTRNAVPGFCDDVNFLLN